MAYNPYTGEEDTSNNMFGVTNTNAANNLNTQTAFRPNSFLDNRIKMMQGLQDQGFDQPNLPALKQRDWNQFQKKQIPLSLDKNLYKDVEGYTADAGNVMNDANILQPDFGQVNKMSMIPEGFIDKMKSLYGGIRNTDAAQTMNTGNKYANLADEAWANKQVIRTPGGEIVVDTESGEVYPDIASFPRQEQVTEETAPIRTDFGRIDPLTTNQKPGFFQGIGQKLGMTQVSDADRAANEQFMTEQGIGIDNTGRMVGGDVEGMNVAGKSGWGSANFDEMRGNWLDKFGDVEYSDTAHGRAKKAKQDRLKKAEAAYQVKLQQQAAAEKTRQDALRDAGAYSSQVQMDPGGGGSWHQQTAAKEAAGQQEAGPGFGKGAYFYQGGRVGYNEGGRVGILAAF